MKNIYRFTLILVLVLLGFSIAAQAQDYETDFAAGKDTRLNIENFYGRISIETDENAERIFLKAARAAEREVVAEFRGSRLEIKVEPSSSRDKRIDLNLVVPERLRVKLTTDSGEVRVAGNYESVEVKTATGTIAADLPLTELKYNFVWTSSRPRFLSDVDLDEVKEKAAGKFVVSGKIIDGADVRKSGVRKPVSAESDAESGIEKKVEIDFTTSRGIILLNVDPSSVPSDLGEKPLTKAAQAIIKSGDSILMDAIRRAAPKHFSDYASTLPPFRSAPVLTPKNSSSSNGNSSIKKVLVQVTDSGNRAISGLKEGDFILTERGEEREIVSVEPETTSFNLVLLVDVSGSVDNYVNFIRKAARNFVNTVNENDRVAIIIFNDDIEVLSNFTKDKRLLSESLDTFDAGGGTAYYDALGYVLAETLRPLKGDRTGIVVLSDGEDTRSFLPFNALVGAIEESGALIYPLYVPNGLIAATKNQDPKETIDPLRARYFGLSSKAESEGERLAKISGGVYYPIRQLDELQKAYDDIVIQLRTAYSVTYRSDLPVTKGSPSPFLKVRVKRENAFVKLGSVVDVPDGSSDAKPSKIFAAPLIFGSAAYRPLTSHSTEPSPDRFSDDAKSGSAEISGEVERINYKPFLADDLRTFKLENFDVNSSPGAFLLNNGNEKIAVSRWISPKRTRSYPYERVYDTIAFAGRKVAVIPVVKDEGLGGDRDFLQWDTISLLSLLDVHVVLAYYDDAVKNTKKSDKITSQKLDETYVLSRLNEVFSFNGTAREWNEREVKNLKPVLEKAKIAYREVSKKTQTYLHDEDALDELIKMAETPEKFIEFSRGKSQKAQNRESQTFQPKEALSSDSKRRVTITNALFGKYFFTVDETLIDGGVIYLIEAKHSQRSKFPSENDIKDGLLKVMLYTNLQNVKLGIEPREHKVQIRLTSAKLSGTIRSDADAEAFDKFCTANAIDLKQKAFLKTLFKEAQENNFTIILEHGATAK